MTDPRRLAELVRATPHVVALHAGVAGEIGTYLPGERVPGIRISDDAVEVHLVVDDGQPLTRTADEVRRALLPVVGTRPIHVVVGDVLLSEAAPPPPPSSTTPTPTASGRPATTPAGVPVPSPRTNPIPE